MVVPQNFMFCITQNVKLLRNTQHKLILLQYIYCPHIYTYINVSHDFSIVLLIALGVTLNRMKCDKNTPLCQLLIFISYVKNKSKTDILFVSVGSGQSCVDSTTAYSAASHPKQ